MQHGKALDQREPIEIIRDYSRWKAEKSLRKYFIYFIRVSYAYHTRILRESYANPTRITVIFVRRESGTETLAFIFLASSKPPEPSTIDGPRTFYSSGKNEITRIIRVYVGIYAFFFFHPNERKFSSLGSRCLLLSIFRKNFRQVPWIKILTEFMNFFHRFSRRISAGLPYTFLANLTSVEDIN